MLYWLHASGAAADWWRSLSGFYQHGGCIRPGGRAAGQPGSRPRPALSGGASPHAERRGSGYRRYTRRPRRAQSDPLGGRCPAGTYPHGEGVWLGLARRGRRPGTTPLAGRIFCRPAPRKRRSGPPQVVRRMRPTFPRRVAQSLAAMVRHAGVWQPCESRPVPGSKGLASRCAESAGSYRPIGLVSGVRQPASTSPRSCPGDPVE